VCETIVGHDKNPRFLIFEEELMKCWLVLGVRRDLILVICLMTVVAAAGMATGCGGGSSVQPQAAAMGTVAVSISDPPSCKNPNGNFDHVYITITSVQANISGTAGDSDSGWQELAPQLATQPMQIDLFSAAQTNCVLAQLGSASLPVGSYQQIRLVLLSNTPTASAALPTTNACAGNGYNCVVLSDNSVHELDLSSQANSGLKIPPGQIVGGPIQVSAGQSVDLNIDFNACASLLQEGNGQWRLKPVLTAGQISPNNSGIGGQVVDSVSKAPIAGNVFVAIEQPDSAGIDRVVMEAAADASGNFRFCPLPSGTFDIVAVAVGPNNLPYNATAVVNVPNGVNLSAIPLVAETGAVSPAVLQGFVTASTASGGATVDVSLAALQPISFGSSPTSRQLTIPLESIASSGAGPAVSSTGVISISSNTDCPTGSPTNANCAEYTLVVPGSNPNVGVYSASGVSYTAPGAGDVLFTVDALAAVPLSGGTADCVPSELMTSKDATGQPLMVTAGGTTNVARIDFSGCS
jgi:hypothetical protein